MENIMSGMHMIRGVQVHGVGKRRRAKRKSNKLLKAQAEHDKFLEKLGVGKSKGDYRYDLPNYTVDNNYPPTSDKICSNGTKKDSVKYSGEEIIGIAATHKSNLMPISNKKDAVAASQMRR